MKMPVYINIPVIHLHSAWPLDLSSPCTARGKQDGTGIRPSFLC